MGLTSKKDSETKVGETLGKTNVNILLQDLPEVCAVSQLYLLRRTFCKAQLLQIMFFEACFGKCRHDE